MARGYGRRRGNGLSPKMIIIIAVAGLVVLIGALFFFAGQADSKKPEQTEIRVPATNVAPQDPAAAAAPPAGAPNAPTQ